jgi:RimJ/RimL family protein N-acetyltransferase
MTDMREELLMGLDYLNAATSLLQRRRLASRDTGLYDAAELHFWWRVPNLPDTHPQLFWFDPDGLPAAAVLAYDFSNATSLLYTDTTIVVLVLPDASPEWHSHVIDRGLAHLAEHNIASMELEVAQGDAPMISALSRHNFSLKETDVLVEAGLDAAAKPDVSELHDGYRLFGRNELLDRPHHMHRDDRPDMEERLNQTSLYRSDHDLVVLDKDDNVAAYGMFWYDPVTAMGVVEPMRTADDHQQRGLARHILTSGIDRLAKAGAKHISIGYEPENPASGHLYRDVGFIPGTHTDLYARTT